MIQASQHFHLLAYPEKGCHQPLDIYFQQQSFGFVQHYHMQALKAGTGQEAELFGKNVTCPEVFRIASKLLGKVCFLKLMPGVVEILFDFW